MFLMLAELNHGDRAFLHGAHLVVLMRGNVGQQVGAALVHSHLEGDCVTADMSTQSKQMAMPLLKSPNAASL